MGEAYAHIPTVVSLFMLAIFSRISHFVTFCSPFVPLVEWRIFCMFSNFLFSKLKIQKYSFHIVKKQWKSKRYYKSYIWWMCCLFDPVSESTFFFSLSYNNSFFSFGALWYFPVPSVSLYKIVCLLGIKIYVAATFTRLVSGKNNLQLVSKIWDCSNNRNWILTYQVTHPCFYFYQSSY